MSACRSSLERDLCIHVVEAGFFLPALSRILTLLGSRRVAGNQTLATASAFSTADCCQMPVRNIWSTLILSSVLAVPRYTWKTRKRRLAPTPVLFEVTVISVRRNRLIITLHQLENALVMFRWFCDCGEDPCFREAFSKILWCSVAVLRWGGLGWEGIKGLWLLPSSPEAVMVKTRGSHSPRPCETQARLSLWHLNSSSSQYLCFRGSVKKNWSVFRVCVLFQLSVKITG